MAMSKLPTAPRGVDLGAKVIHLSDLLGATVVTSTGEPIGRVDDIIVRLPNEGAKFKRSSSTIVWDQPAPGKWTDARQNHHLPENPVS